jgi:hypothetical protein
MDLKPSAARIARSHDGERTIRRLCVVFKTHAVAS